MPDPSHEVRNAMMKLGSHWEVKRCNQGKKRPPAEVAQELDERMRKKARELLSSSGTKPSSQSNLDGAESSTPEFLTPTGSLAKPASGNEPRSSEVIAGSGVGKPIAIKESQAGLRAFFCNPETQY